MKLIKAAINLISVISVLMISSCGDEPNREDIIGIWQGEFREYDLTFHFRSDFTCRISTIERASGIVEELNGTFNLDFSKKPFSLTIRNISELNNPLFTIIEFTDENTIRLAQFAPKWRFRPITFGSESMNLERINKGD